MEEIEKTKLEKLFKNHGDLRALIPRLLEQKLYYKTLLATNTTLNQLFNILNHFEIKMGDCILINKLLKETDGETIEKEAKKKGPMNKKKDGKLLLVFI